jgi:2-phospho-L-lactate guanylyltransferase
VATAVLVPIKAFNDAKARLTGALDATERADLARRMAATVIAAASPLPVYVACDNNDVAEFALAHHARVVWCPARGLNGAVSDGVAAIEADGFERVIVAHGDLPLATSLQWVADFAGVTIVPDRHDDGTNVISLPTALRFEFSYGAGSFRRHSAEAARLGVPLRVVRHRALGHDVDLPSDLSVLLPLTQIP